VPAGILTLAGPAQPGRCKTSKRPPVSSMEARGKSGERMDVTTPSATSLEFISVVPVFAVPLALLVSLALLWIYRRAVIRSMERRATPKETAGQVQTLEGARAGEPPRQPPRQPPRHLLEIVPHDPPPGGVRFAVRRAALPAAAVQLCAGLAYAVVMTSSWLFVGHLGFEWHLFLVMSIWFALPIVPAVGLTIAVSWRGFAMLAIGYALVFAGVAIPILFDTSITAGQALSWLNANAIPTLLAIAFLARPIRAVGSLVLVFMLAAVGGAIFALLTFSPQGRVFYWAYIGIFAAAVLLLLAGAVATGIAGWLLLRSLVGGTSAGAALTHWLNTNATGRFLAPVLARPIGMLLARPVSALVGMFIILAVAGAIVVVAVFESDEDTSVLLLTILKLGIVGDVVLLLLVMAIPTGIVGWLLLRGIGNLYRARRISDQSIMIDSVWLMFSMLQSPTTGAAREHVGLTAAIAIGAFAAYRLTATVGFWLLRAAADNDAQAPTLLLLRVFSLGRRSERLFAGFTKLWRHIGSVRMIAGPDLATSTVEPHEFLDFLAGRLQRRFITGPDTFERRLRETEQRRDIDGRFRIANFFCHDDTWQMALRSLVERYSDVVLMDLRGFSERNRGCVFEITELLDVAPLHQIVLVVDRTTNHHFLAQTLADAWATVTKASPNWDDPAPRVRLYHFDGRIGRNIPALVAVVANAGMHHPMRSGAQETSH
jgi:hypothetical protein